MGDGVLAVYFLFNRRHFSELNAIVRNRFQVPGFMVDEFKSTDSQRKG